MHIQYGGRHATTVGKKCGNGNSMDKRKAPSRYYAVYDVKTGKLVTKGTSRELSNHPKISLSIKNISTYAHKKAVHNGMRIEFTEDPIQKMLEE